MFLCFVLLNVGALEAFAAIEVMGDFIYHYIRCIRQAGTLPSSMLCTGWIVTYRTDTPLVWLSPTTNCKQLCELSSLESFATESLFLLSCARAFLSHSSCARTTFRDTQQCQLGLLAFSTWPLAKEANQGSIAKASASSERRRIRAIPSRMRVQTARAAPQASQLCGR